MNVTETGKVLAKIQAFDNRNVDDATTIAWQEILEPYTLADCLSAVTDHFRVSTDWLMPAHVVELVKARQKARLDAFGAQPRLSEHDEATCEDYSAASRALFQAVKTGQMDRASYDRYQGSTVGILEHLQGRKALQ